MNKRTLRVLEFNKIREILKGYTESPLGEERVEALEPVSDYDLVKKRQEETGEAVRILERGYNFTLRGLKDIRKILAKVEKGVVCTPGELLEISDCIRVSRRLKKFMKNRENDREVYEIIDSYIKKITLLADLEKEIERCITGPNEVADNASSKLKDLRTKILGIQNKIKDTLNRIINSPDMRKYLQEHIITIRNDRYVVPVKKEYKGNFPGLVHDQSASGATLFVEPIKVVNLNNDLKELKIKEKREIERILKKLTEKVIIEKDTLLYNLDIMAKLDFIFAKARYSLDINATQPLILKKGSIKIKKARHPLLKGKVVPIDINIGQKFRTLVITGPNTGGKTVSLKTLGLLTLMAQAGLHIPAKWGSEISVFNKIYADIGDEQSIEQNLSTFSSHMTNIIDILKSADDKSLVLLDELGAGTDPSEGAALAISILMHLHEKNVKTVATTHYSELKTFAHSNQGIENASVEFDIETLKPTYKLLIGLPGKSNAFEIAKRLGLPDAIIENARNLISKDELEIEEMLQDIYQNKVKVEKQKEETERISNELKRQKEEYDEQIRHLRKRKEKIVKEAKKEALEIVNRAKEKANKIIWELQKISNEDKDRNKKMEMARRELDDTIKALKGSIIEPIIEEADDPAKDLEPGDNVYIQSLNQKGKVIEEPENGEVLVQIGVMKVNVPVKSLKKLKRGKAKEEEQQQVNFVSVKQSKSVPIEIDLRGLILEDALRKVDKYLDDAYLTGHNQVYIIHGKGTGTLRKGIQNFLQNSSLVKSFRDGKFGEGGKGVTVVKLSVD